MTLSKIIGASLSHELRKFTLSKEASEGELGKNCTILLKIAKIFFLITKEGIFSVVSATSCHDDKLLSPKAA